MSNTNTSEEEKAYTIYIGLTTNMGVKILKPAGWDYIRNLIVKILEWNGILGATINLGEGVWQGEVEDVATVYIGAPASVDMRGLCLQFADTFMQDAVAYHESPSLTFIQRFVVSSTPTASE
jgi:hypothetical protein